MEKKKMRAKANNEGNLEKIKEKRWFSFHLHGKIKMEGKTSKKIKKNEK